MAAARIFFLFFLGGPWAACRRVVRSRAAGHAVGILRSDGSEVDLGIDEGGISQPLECFICLESSSQVASLGCACRGSQPGAHLDCLEQQYLARFRSAVAPGTAFSVEAMCCKTCGIVYKADVILRLAKVGMQEVEKLANDSVDSAREKAIVRNHARAMLAAAWAAKSQERYAEDSLEHGLLLGEEDAFVRSTVYKYPETATAAALLNESLREVRDDLQLSPVHPLVVSLTQQYATQLSKMGLHSKAMRLLWDTKDALNKAGLEAKVSFMTNLALCTSHQQDLPDRWPVAEDILVQILNLGVARHGTHSDTGEAVLANHYYYLSENLICQGKYADAALLLKQRLVLVRKRMGNTSIHSQLAEAWLKLAQKRAKRARNPASGRYDGSPPYAEAWDDYDGAEVGLCNILYVLFIMLLCLRMIIGRLTEPVWLQELEL